MILKFLNYLIWKIQFDGKYNPSEVTATALMISNTAPSGIVTASSANTPEFYAFDQNEDDIWQTTSISNQWIQYEFDSGISINKYSFQNNPTDNQVQMPKDWELVGSNTGLFSGEEVILNSEINQDNWTPLEVRYFTFINSQNYKFYRINIFNNNSHPNNILIGEIKLIKSQ